MRRFGAAVARELREAIPPTIYFGVVFHAVAITKAAFLADYGLTPSGSAMALVGALLVAKAILVTDKLRFTNALSTGPLVYDVMWKPAIFTVFTLAFRVVEELVPPDNEIPIGAGSGPALLHGRASTPLLGPPDVALRVARDVLPRNRVGAPARDEEFQGAAPRFRARSGRRMIVAVLGGGTAGQDRSGLALVRHVPVARRHVHTGEPTGETRSHGGNDA